jgi:hypothetical protein
MEIAWDGAVTQYIRGSRILKRPLADYKAWPDAWRAIVEMKGLKEMRVRFKLSTLYRYGLTRRMLYDSMRNLTGLQVFQLVVPSDEYGNWRYLEGGPLPFEIVKEAPEIKLYNSIHRFTRRAPCHRYSPT